MRLDSRMRDRKQESLLVTNRLVLALVGVVLLIGALLCAAEISVVAISATI